MKANELRIGNLILDTISNKVVRVRPNMLRVIQDEGEDEVYLPISLTEEWLVKFGFEKELMASWLSPKVGDSQTRIRLSISGTFYCPINEFRTVKLPYVHNLQNFMFELQEGKELLVKE